MEQKLQSFKATLVGKNLTPQDYDEAEKAIICFVQKQRFAGEIALLKGDSNVSKDSPLYKLDHTWAFYGPRATPGPWAVSVRPAASTEEKSLHYRGT